MILVTGATGFAGSHLVDRLAAECRVAAWAHSGGRRPQEQPRVEWHDVDLLNRRAVSQALAAIRPDTIYHLAGAPHVGSSFDNPSEALAINALGTHHLLAAIEAEAVNARVVVVTSAMIYGASSDAVNESSPVLPDSPYGLSKLAQDRLAQLAAADGLNAVIARPFNHTGPRQAPTFAVPEFARQIARIEAGAAEPVIHVGNLDAERDLTDVRDVVSGYATVAAHGETAAAYNVCSGRAHRIGDLLDMLLSRARQPIRIEVDPARVRPIERPRLLGDSSRLRALGWSPRIPIETTIQDVLEYWRAQPA